jgi:hypothetical protein
MTIDYDFITKFIDLFSRWKSKYLIKPSDREISDLEPIEEFDASLAKALNDQDYIEMYKMLGELNEEEYLDFLTIYYLGIGTVSNFKDGRKQVRKLDKHPVEKILGKSNLDGYLIEGHKLFKE